MSRRATHERRHRGTVLTLGFMLPFAVAASTAAPIVEGSRAVATPDRLVSHAVVRHITLDASSPEDEQSVSEVSEVRLFFSEPPLMRGASIRVVDSSRKLVRSSPPEADADDASQLSVQIAQGLAVGRYVVQWRCIADDGHVMRGSLTFDVVGQ